MIYFQPYFNTYRNWILVFVSVLFFPNYLFSQKVGNYLISERAELLYRLSRNSATSAIWNQSLTKVRDFHLFQQIEYSNLNDVEKELYQLLESYYHPQKMGYISLLGDTTTNISWMSDKSGYSLVRHQSENFRLAIFPIIGREWNSMPDKVLGFRTHNYQGFEAEGSIGKNQTFFIHVTDHQGRLNYQPGWIRTTIPSYGFLKNDQVKPGNVDFNDVYVEYVIDTDYGTFSLGKNTPNWSINNESVMLSDHVAAFPNVRWIKNFDDQFSYETMWGELSYFSPINLDTLNQKKYLAAHRLTYSPNNHFRFSFFESIIYAGRSFEPVYHIPFIFMRGAEHYEGSPDNANLGVSVEYNLTPQWFVGYQFLIDDITIGNVFDKVNNNKFAHLLAFANYGHLFSLPYQLKITSRYLHPLTYLHRNVLTDYYHYGDVLGIDSDVSRLNTTFEMTIFDRFYSTGIILNTPTVRTPTLLKDNTGLNQFFVEFRLMTLFAVKLTMSSENSFLFGVRMGL